MHVIHKFMGHKESGALEDPGGESEREGRGVAKRLGAGLFEPENQ